MIAVTLGASQSGLALKEASYLESIVVPQFAPHLAASRNDNHVPETNTGYQAPLYFRSDNRIPQVLRN
jgi:hypothetical protein